MEGILIKKQLKEKYNIGYTDACLDLLLLLASSTKDYTAKTISVTKLKKSVQKLITDKNAEDIESK